MELTQNQCILMGILDCGYEDLESLENIHYDLDDIIKDIVYNDNLSFNGLLRVVFFRGIDDLTEKFLQKRDEIKEEILCRIHEVFDGYILNQGMDYEELLENEDYQKLLNDYELINDEQFRPDNNNNWYLNFQDSHVYVKNMDFYRHYLENDVESIEYNMGWSFEDKNY